MNNPALALDIERTVLIYDTRSTFEISRVTVSNFGWIPVVVELPMTWADSETILPRNYTTTGGVPRRVEGNTITLSGRVTAGGTVCWGFAVRREGAVSMTGMIRHYVDTNFGFDQVADSAVKMTTVFALDRLGQLLEAPEGGTTDEHLVEVVRDGVERPFTDELKWVNDPQSLSIDNHSLRSTRSHLDTSFGWLGEKDRPAWLP